MKRILSRLRELEYQVTILIASLLVSGGTKAQISTGNAFDTTTPPDGIPDVWMDNAFFTGSGTSFSVNGHTVTVVGGGGGALYIDTTWPSDGIYDVALAPAFLRGSSHVRLSYSGPFGIIEGSSNADSLDDVPIDLAGVADLNTLVYSSILGKIVPVAVPAGDAYFITGIPIGSLDTTLDNWGLKYNLGTQSFIQEDWPTGGSGSADSLGWDTGGVAGIDAWTLPTVLKEGAGIRFYPGAGPDTMYVAATGISGLWTALNNADSMMYIDTLTGDTAIKVSNNNALAQTIISTDARQTGGIRFNGTSVIDARSGGLTIGDLDAGVNRTYIEFLADTMWIGDQLPVGGATRIWQFMANVLTANSSTGATINGPVEWDGNLFDKYDIDTTYTEWVFGAACKGSSTATNQFQTLGDVTALIADSLNEYPDTVMLNDSAQDAEADAKLAIRDTLVKGAAFDSIKIDTGFFSSVVASEIVEVRGDTSGSIALAGVTAGFNKIIQPDSGGEATWYWPQNGAVATDTGKFLCLGSGYQSRWADVPTSWDWSDSSSRGPDSVKYSDTSAFARDLDTITAAAALAYIGNHATTPFIDTMVNNTSLFWAAGVGGPDSTFRLKDSLSTLFLFGLDLDTVRMFEDAAKVYVGPPGLTYAESLQVGFIEGSAGHPIIAAVLDSIYDKLGRFSGAAAGSVDTAIVLAQAGGDSSKVWLSGDTLHITMHGQNGAGDTLHIVHVEGSNAIGYWHLLEAGAFNFTDDSTAFLFFRGHAAGNDDFEITMAADTTILRSINSIIRLGDDRVIVKGQNGASLLADSVFIGAVTGDSLAGTRNYARKVAGDSAGTRTLSTDFGKVTDDTTSWNAILAKIRDTVTVMPIPVFRSFVDPKNFGADTVTLMKFDSACYVGGATVQQAAFESILAAVSDTIIIWEVLADKTTWSVIDTLILSNATGILSETFDDASIARGSYLVATMCKSGNTIGNVTLTVRCIGGN